MEFETKIIGKVETGERSKDIIVVTEPTDEAKERLKQQLFGEHTEFIHPEVTDLLASVVPNGSDVTFDAQTRDALAFASEVGLNPGEILIRAYDVLARHAVNGLSEITVDGPGGDQIRLIELQAFSILDQQQISNRLSLTEISATERAAKLLDLPPLTIPSGTLQEGVQTTLPTATSIK